jgi:cyclophilin family peptidyl-prolyl cis-trans isomerase
MHTVFTFKNSKLKNKALLGLVALVFLIQACGRPIAQFSVRSVRGIAPAKIQFQNMSQKADRYIWNFGDGSPETTDSVASHTFRQSGNYLVTLKAFKGNKMSQTEQRVLVEAPLECTFEIETNLGNMVGILYNATPQHRENFIKLADEHFFDELIFHRVINGFMVQGGDPNSRNAPAGASLGSGGPGYTVPAEFDDTLVHLKGALAAARTGDAVNPKKESSGSQFYIVHGRPMTKQQIDMIEGQKGIRYTPEQRKTLMEDGGTPFLDREYTVFGRITQGLDILDKIAAQRTDGRDRPQADIVMKVRIIR